VLFAVPAVLGAAKRQLVVGYLAALTHVKPASNSSMAGWAFVVSQVKMLDSSPY
jgi:hypothetical protein